MRIPKSMARSQVSIPEINLLSILRNRAESTATGVRNDNKIIRIAVLEVELQMQKPRAVFTRGSVI